MTIPFLAACAVLVPLQGRAPDFPAVPKDVSAPVAAMRSTGTGLTLALPASVTVGVSFFDPPPIPVSVRVPKTLKGKPVASVTGVPPGVSATLTGASGGFTLVLRHCTAAPVGRHRLTVQVRVGAAVVAAPIVLIRTRARILLVDDDYSDNNRSSGNTTPSKSDTAFGAALRLGDGARDCVWDTVVVDSQSPGPAVAALEPYDVVIWYCGTSYGGNPDGNATVGGVDESNLRAWLDGGKNRTLLLFSPGYVNNVQGYVPSAGSNENKWNVTENTFLKRYLGCVGGQGLLKRFADADIDILGKAVSMARSPLEAQLSPVNPGSAQALATAMLNPDAKGERAVPVAVWNRVGDAHTAFVGFTWENLFQRETFFKSLLSLRISELR